MRSIESPIKEHDPVLSREIRVFPFISFTGKVIVPLEKALENAPEPTKSETLQKCAADDAQAWMLNYEMANEEGLGDTPMPDIMSSIPTMLFDAGFDVWIDGNRGTLY